MLKLRGRRKTVHVLAFSADGHWLAGGGGYSGGVHLWDSLNGTLIHQWDIDLCYLGGTQFFFTADNQVLVPSLDGWEVCDPKTKTTILHKHDNRGWVALSPNGRLLCSVSEERELQMFNFTAKQSTKRWLVKTYQKQRVYANWPAFSADSERLATIDRPNWTIENDQTLVIRRSDDGKRELEFPCPSVGIMALHFAADGRYVAGMTARTVLWWDLEQPGKNPERITNPGRRHLAGLALHPDGERYATIDNDRFVRIWDRRQPEPINMLEWDIGKLYSVAFSPDGCRAAIGSSRGAVLLWDLE